MNNNEQKKENQKNDINQRIAQLELQSRILYINDPIDKDSAFKLNRTLILLDEISNDPIKIFINSPGGEVSSGFFIFDCIRFVRSPVYIIGAGLIASAAALIYLAVDKEYRMSLPHARYMLHQPLAGMRGVVTDLEIHAREVSNLKDTINKIIAKATGNSLKKIEEDTDRDFWLGAEEAKKYGIVNTIISKKSDFETLFPIPKKSSVAQASLQSQTSTKTPIKTKVSAPSKEKHKKKDDTEHSDTVKPKKQKTVAPNEKKTSNTKK